MQTIINEYVYTLDVVEQSTRLFCRKMNKWYFIGAFLFVGFYFLLFLLFLHTLFLFMMVILVVAIYVVFFIRERRLIRSEKKRIRLLYPDAPKTRITLGEYVEVQIGDTYKKIDWHAIDKVAQSKTCILLNMDNNVFFPIMKDGFVQGTSQECIQLIETKLKANKNR